MKTFYNYIKESNEVKILELSYFDFINICDIYDVIKHKDNYGNTICDIVNKVKEQPEFSKQSNKYRFLVAIQDKKIQGVFYKQLGGNPNRYDMGYIISKGVGKILFNEMRKLGSYTTFSNIGNIPSLKSQLSMGAQIICICDNAPDKSNGSYNQNFSDENLKQLMIDEKIYYRDADEEFYFFDEKGNLNIKGFTDFLLSHDRIELVVPKPDMASQIKVYFLFNEL